MAKNIFTLISLVAFASISQSIALILSHGPDSLPVEKLSLIPTTTQIQFYMQVVDEGGNETSYRIANASITNQSPTGFGFLNMMDNLLTETPDPKSNVMGHAQGLIGGADLKVIGVYNSFNVLFTSGIYNGSTLNIAGRDPVISNYRELSVLGGTKCFRLATGIVTLRDLSLDIATMDGVIEFNITVIQPANANACIALL